MKRRTKTISSLFAVLVVALSGQVSNAELVGLWKFDEGSGDTVFDSGGYGHNGTLHGEPTWRSSEGFIYGALEFDGSDDYVATDFVLDPSRGPFSAFAWIKDGVAGRTVISQAKGTGNGQKWLCTSSLDGRLMSPLINRGRFPAPLTSGMVVTDHRWHHIGLVWDGRDMRLYVDGKEAAKYPNALSGLRASKGGMYFGAGETLSKSDFWSGLIDDIRIYDHAMDPSQIEVLAFQSKDPVSALVVAPKTIYAQAPATVSVTAVTTTYRGPAVVPVDIWFAPDTPASTQVFEGITDENGRLTARFDTPDVEPGVYTVKIDIEGVRDSLTAQVLVHQMPVLLIETDKPIYKPGQTIRGRILVLTNGLRPISSEVNVEITDGKGVKIYRKLMTTNSFGVAPFELDLANELNFGTWKIAAESGLASGTVDVRVEKYVLPRFDVELLTGKDYFLVGEQISGAVNASYFFGKSVDGTVEVRASRYVGVWEEYASYTATLSDGIAEFLLPAVGYVSGTSGAGGAGSAQLEVTVTDTSGHEEKTTTLLKIVNSTIQHQLIASSRSITPGYPFDVLLVAETPDGQPVTVSAKITCQYVNQNYGTLSEKKITVSNFTGSTTVSFVAPGDTNWAVLRSSVIGNGESAESQLTVYAAYSPSDSFLHLRRISDNPINVGDMVTLDVFRTHEATVYYDVFANGHTVWSDATTDSQIVFQATQQMVPSAKVVAYIINPNNEISADTFPLEVVISSAAELKVDFDDDQVLPGDAVHVSVEANTKAMIGLAIVDESVYALNEGRLNMQEVFNELEDRFMEPQAESHPPDSTYGAYEVFDKAGLQVVASDTFNLPQGQPVWSWGRGGAAPMVGPGGRTGGGVVSPPDIDYGGQDDAVLAEVTRIRQFFPETWLWMPDLLTGPDGTAGIDLTAPDSITTWRLHAVSTSSNGLGISESELLVFQEFFGEPDLPYAVTRGEQFPVRIQIFNYLDEPQLVHVELADAEWFDLLEPGVQQVSVNANSVGLASFLIQPTKLGHNTIEVTLRSSLRADAVRKELLVEPEGTQRELVTNGMIRAGQTLTLDTDMPQYRVPGSGKLLLSVTPSLVAQSINGVDDLLHMPYGCGEQNMIFFAPDVEILRYLDATEQLIPEVRAKAEHFITVGYQRELTYCRQDGSFSAFGDSDASGSLWLTAFVLGTFSAARDIQTVDENVLANAAGWIEAHQLNDGSWEPVGFLHHRDMMGGVAGSYALTAFVSIALSDYGMARPEVLTDAAIYLENYLPLVQDDPYSLAIAALAFVRLNKTGAAENTISRLLEIAISNDSGIHWEPHAVETTSYAALAMIEAGYSQVNAAVKWLSLQQNSRGGFGSTQETIMALRALLKAAQAQTHNVNLTISARRSDNSLLAQFTIDSSNFDVLQIAELPAGTDTDIELSAGGSGETRFQLVRRFNVFLTDQIIENNMTLEVTYDAKHVEIDDIVNVTAVVRYFGLQRDSGMMIVDVGVPTGFAVVPESIDALVDAGAVSKTEVAGRKVILYVDGLTNGEQRTFTFQVKARFPVRAMIPDSKAYLYYEPEVRAEAAGTSITAGFSEDIADPN